MIDDDKYTIEVIANRPFGNGFICGDIYRSMYMTDGRLIEEVIVGPYCFWPKQEPMSVIVLEEPGEVFIDRKVIFKQNDDAIKFYQKLNRKKW